MRSSPHQYKIWPPARQAFGSEGPAPDRRRRRRRAPPRPFPLEPGAASWGRRPGALRTICLLLRLLILASVQLSSSGVKMFVPCGTSEPDFTGFTLLMPAVSVGNVGQLAIDLIISTLNMCKVGYFYTDCLVPMVGNNPYATAEENSTELSINAEVYSAPSMNLMALQLRSIFIKYKSKPFCEKLISWVKRSKCARVIVLSSSHSYHCDDQQLRSIPFRYLLTPEMEKSVGEALQKLHWKEMEKSKSFPEIRDSELCVRIPGGGITKSLYTESCSKGIQMAVVLKFVSEGDNIPDAFDLVRYLNDWLQIIKPQECSDSTTSVSQWKMPSSWRLLFGSGLPPALF